MLEIKVTIRHQPDRYVGSRSAHVGQLLLAHNIDIEIGVFGVLADDHAFVNVNARADEECAALLEIVESVRCRKPSSVGDQRAGWAMRDFSLPLDVAIKQRVHDNRAARVGQQRAAQTDQAAAGHAEFDAHASIAMIVHIGDFAFARADKFFGNIDGEVFDRFHQFASFSVVLGDNLRLADHQLVAFAPHHLNQNRELQFAAA